MVNIESEITRQALKYVKDHRKDLIENFASKNKYPPDERPFSIFMAGSPGAGKTEFSKSLIKSLEQDTEIKIVRIDADEIREMLPQFNGRNADLVQPAAALGVEKLFDYVQDHNQNIILDGTFANYEISRKNIERALRRGRIVVIAYVYQRPEIAWLFTKRREYLEGRFVPEQVFIDTFLSAKENVERAKREFGKAVSILIVVKDWKYRTENIHVNVDEVEKYLPASYTRKKLESTVRKMKENEQNEEG
jgi:UDP-N-acetylglucosamine kinase